MISNNMCIASVAMTPNLIESGMEQCQHPAFKFCHQLSAEHYRKTSNSSQAYSCISQALVAFNNQSSVWEAFVKRSEFYMGCINHSKEPCCRSGTDETDKMAVRQISCRAWRLTRSWKAMRKSRTSRSHLWPLVLWIIKIPSKMPVWDRACRGDNGQTILLAR